MCTCQASLENLAFCSQCGALNIVELTSPFGVFGLEEVFSIDISFLTQLYLNLQNKLHPDRFSHNEEEKKLAEKYSSYLNGAYHVLKNPLKRAEVLLKDFSTSFSQLDLVEQIEKREWLESLSSLEALSNFEKNMREEKNKTESEMAFFFKEENKEKAHLCLIKLKYIYRLLEEISIKYDERR